MAPRRYYTLLLIAAALAAQTNINGPVVTIMPKADGTAAASIGLREKRPNGTNRAGFTAPDALAADLFFKLPSTDGAAGACLNTDGSKNLSFSGVCEVYVSSFNHSTTVGSGVTGDLSAAGSKTLTYAICPLGVNGTNTSHYFRISGGTGTAEAALLTGGTCVGGSAGTIIITTANTHTGSWVVSSASAGITEAMWSLPSGGGRLRASPGVYSFYQTVNLSNGTDSTNATIANFELTCPSIPSRDSSASTKGCVFQWAGPSGGTMMVVRGSTEGIKLYGIRLEGGASANRLLDVIGCTRCDFENNSFIAVAANQYAVRLEATSTLSTTLNTWKGNLVHSTASGTGCFTLGTINTTPNGFVNNNFFASNICRYPDDTATSIGWKLKYTDNNVFKNNWAQPSAGTTAGCGVKFDQPGDLLIEPYANIFENNIMGSITGAKTGFCGTSGTYKNTVIASNQIDGGPFTSGTNLNVYEPYLSTWYGDTQTFTDNLIVQSTSTAIMQVKGNSGVSGTSTVRLSAGNNFGFVGTFDAQPFYIRTTNVDMMKFAADGSEVVMNNAKMLSFKDAAGTARPVLSRAASNEVFIYNDQISGGNIVLRPNASGYIKADTSVIPSTDDGASLGINLTNRFQYAYLSRGVSLNASSTGLAPEITWRNDSAATNKKRGALVYDYTTTESGWLFQKLTDAGAFSANLVHISQQNARIGIGVVNPTVALDVLGNTLLTGNLTLTGTCTGCPGSLITDGGATTYITATGDNFCVGCTTTGNKFEVSGGASKFGGGLNFAAHNSYPIGDTTNLVSSIYSVTMELGKNASNSGNLGFRHGTTSGVAYIQAANVSTAVDLEITASMYPQTNGTLSQGLATRRYDFMYANNYNISGACTMQTVSGAPTGACTTCWMRLRTDGGAGSTLYVCENSAWVAK